MAENVDIDDRYEVLDVLGRGGFATVYRARQSSVGREVAIKVLDPRSSGADQVGERFREEARITSTLRHPNTLKLFDFGCTASGRLYLVTELLVGVCLSEALEGGRRLSVPRALRIVKDVALALEEAHAHGIVHRDLKPANIFLVQVGQREHAKVLDFGIAKVLDGHVRTATGTIFGTPAYMAPEQIRDEPLDGRCDLYSLGLVAFVSLTGRRLFEAGRLDMLRRKQNEKPPHLHTIDPALDDPELDALVRGLLQPVVAHRTPSAAALIAQIEALEDRHREPTGRPAPRNIKYTPTLIPPSDARLQPTLVSSPPADGVGDLPEGPEGALPATTRLDPYDTHEAQPGSVEGEPPAVRRWVLALVVGLVLLTSVGILSAVFDDEAEAPRTETPSSAP